MQKVVLGIVLLLIAATLYSLFDIITSSQNERASMLSEIPADETQKSLIHGKRDRLSVKEKKRRFIQTVLPAVQRVKKELDAEYARVKALAEAPERTPLEEAWLQEMMARYNVAGIPCLLRRLHTHPVSIVIAQAALETGWGSSRFFKEANNIFGIWSYHEDEPRMAASEKRGEKTVYVKKFASYDAAVRGYFKMIGGGYAYGAFREARLKSDDPFVLLRHLRHYSELRDEYVARLYYVIKANKLYTYDDPSYRPVALSKIIPEYVAMKQADEEKKKLQKQQLYALNEVKIEPEEITPPAPCEAEPVTPQAPARSTAIPVGSTLP